MIITAILSTLIINTTFIIDNIIFLSYNYHSKTIDKKKNLFYRKKFFEKIFFKTNKPSNYFIFLHTNLTWPNNILMVGKTIHCESFM